MLKEISVHLLKYQIKPTKFEYYDLLTFSF